MSTARRSSTRNSGGGSTSISTTAQPAAPVHAAGSGCSVISGNDVPRRRTAPPRHYFYVFSDIKAARKELVEGGVAVSEVFHSAGAYAGADEPYLFGRVRVSGPDLEHGSDRSFASFRDPDGNGWLFQEITTRQAGRIDSTATTFASANDTGERASARGAGARQVRGGARSPGRRHRRLVRGVHGDRAVRVRNCRM